MYNGIRIERERDGFKVRVSDPEIEKSNRKSSGAESVGGSWRDPNVEFEFDTKDQVLEFIEKAMDIALPKDDYSTAFDKLAKEAKGKSDE